MTRPQLSFEPFSEQLLLEQFGERETVHYLHSYLAELTATAVLVEERYVDRHFVDDFAAYYARSFSPPTKHCRRLHFFKTIVPEDLQQKLRECVSGKDADSRIRQKLRDCYLGFAVWRPLVGASLGRTVLKTYHLASLNPQEATRTYRVNLLGL